MSAKELEQKRSELRKKMDQTGKKMALKTPEKKKSTLTAKDISLGDAVKVLSLNVKGTINKTGCKKEWFCTNGNSSFQSTFIRFAIN